MDEESNVICGTVRPIGLKINSNKMTYWKLLRPLLLIMPHSSMGTVREGLRREETERLTFI